MCLNILCIYLNTIYDIYIYIYVMCICKCICVSYINEQVEMPGDGLAGAWIVLDRGALRVGLAIYPPMAFGISIVAFTLQLVREKDRGAVILAERKLGKMVMFRRFRDVYFLLVVDCYLQKVHMLIILERERDIYIYIIYTIIYTYIVVHVCFMLLT